MTVPQIGTPERTKATEDVRQAVALAAVIESRSPTADLALPVFMERTADWTAFHWWEFHQQRLASYPGRFGDLQVRFIRTNNADAKNILRDLADVMDHLSLIEVQMYAEKRGLYRQAKHDDPYLPFIRSAAPDSPIQYQEAKEQR
jgi:hypothetical protein